LKRAEGLMLVMDTPKGCLLVILPTQSHRASRFEIVKLC